MPTLNSEQKQTPQAEPERGNRLSENVEGGDSLQNLSKYSGKHLVLAGKWNTRSKLRQYE